MNKDNRLSLVFGLGKIVILLMLIIVVFRSLTSSNFSSFNFTTFLEALNTAPTIDVSWASSLKVPDWLGDIWIIGPLLDLIASGAAFATYITAGLLNFVSYVAWVFSFMFI